MLEHNYMDAFPNIDQPPGSAYDGIFLQGLYGSISKLTIDNNYIHTGYWDVEVSPNGSYPITGPAVTNNCLAWPSGSGSSAVSDPNHTISVWSGNTKCDLSGNDTGQAVPYTG